MKHMEASASEHQISCAVEGEVTFNLITPLQMHLLPIDDVRFVSKEGVEPVYTAHVDLTIGLKRLRELGFPLMMHAQSII